MQGKRGGGAVENKTLRGRVFCHALGVGVLGVLLVSGVVGEVGESFEPAW